MVLAVDVCLDCLDSVLYMMVFDMHAMSLINSWLHEGMNEVDWIGDSEVLMCDCSSLYLYDVLIDLM